ncbi:late blight resistance homolog R1A-3 isoform X1 [Olea europaea subsp. europaea]|uniref:Late blight resistance homolog R1A-3 isoform X1 n=1 Tax=Olea europaea subsp. europaea TaxID=158383 RepID=A0A8S0QEM7_OLEEU|nr:late blight resistance homolog R1A-3 isoform X1 [Olea europaea subsp. europaea]
MFRNKSCPQELLEIVKQIAIKCHSLPLAMVVIAGVLANMENKEHLWEEVARNLSSHLSKNSDNYIQILELSYNHLPMHLKPCFLYFGAYKEDEEIHIQKLISLWVAEGYIKKEEHKSLEDVALEYAQSSLIGACLIGLPINLKQLTLVDTHTSPEQTEIIGKLRYLEVLKLLGVTFEGEQWDTREDEFPQLKFLKLSSVELAEWNTSRDHFPRLRLALECCVGWKIPPSLGDIPTLLMIEVYEYGRAIKKSAKKIQEEQEDMGNEYLKVIISSRDWENLSVSEPEEESEEESDEETEQ